MELDPAVDVPVTVNTAWSGPDGTAITSATRAEMNSGNYTCMAGIENGLHVSASTNIKIGR